MRTERAWTIAATAGGVLAFAAQWWGLHPVALTLLLLATWLVVAMRRWGFALGAAAVVVGWMSLVLAVLTATPALGVDPAIVVGTMLVLAIASTVPVVAAVPPAVARDRVARAVLASLVGAGLWVCGLVWGLLAPGGGGLSWATYNDSTGAVWLLRLIIQYGGITSLFHLDDPVPLPYALSASLLPPGTTVADASPASVGAQLSAHGAQWSVTIALASLLAGLVVVALGSREGRHGWPVLAGAAGTSTVLLLAPIAGRILDLGQSNAHVVIVLVASSVLAAADARRHLALSMSVLLAATGLLVVTWSPFAAVPAALALLVNQRGKRARLNRRHVLAWQLPGFAVAAWTLAIYGRDQLSAFVTSDRELNYATIQTYGRAGYWERVGNPYWWPLSIGLLLIAVVLVALHWRRARDVALVAGLSAAGLIAGMLPFFALTRSVPDHLEYFPAKYLSLATICLMPLVVGAALRVFAERRRPVARGAVAACLAVACGLAIAAPLPPATTRWGFAPLMIARGEHYGTGDQVAGRIVEFASNDAVTLPWRYDPPFDTPVALMNSSFGPDVANRLLNPARYVLRNYRNDFGTPVACMLAEGSLVPVVLVTRDPNLEDEVNRECPDARITVRFEPLPAR
jgi:hypothetical protein